MDHGSREHAAPPAELHAFRERSAVPRDLRTRAELEAGGFTRLGAPRALLLEGTERLPLYSTSEARLIRDALWPRGGARSAGAEERPGALSAVPSGNAGSGGAGQWLAELFSEGFVVLDTETTGLTTRDEVIEIGIVDSSGAALLESKVFPKSGAVPAAATRIHGYTIEDLHGAPTWPEVALEVERLISDRRVLAWNAPFDQRLVAQSARRWRLSEAQLAFECAMRGYSAVRGLKGPVKLERAARLEGVLGAAQSHTSVADARLTLAVLRRLLGGRKAPGGRRRPAGAGSH